MSQDYQEIREYIEGILVKRETRVDGELHSIDGQPSLVSNHVNSNKPDVVKFHKEGILHCEDGPAEIQFDYHGAKIRELFYQHGQLHNPNGPAIHNCHGHSGPVDRYFLEGVAYSKALWEKQRQCYLWDSNKQNNGCEGKVVEIDGKKYRLQSID